MMKVVFVDEPMGAIDNLSLNEACFEAVRDCKYDEIFRIYSFERPGIILGKTQHSSDVKNNCGVEITRRKTGGAAVYVDRHTLGYSLFGRFDNIDPCESIPVDVPYKRLTEKVMSVLWELGLDAKLRRHWGIEIDGRVIAGHAKRYSDKTYEVHGLLRLDRWEMRKLENSIRLRKKGSYSGKKYILVGDEILDLTRQKTAMDAALINVERDEAYELETSPSLLEKGVSKDDLIDRLAKSFGKTCSESSDELFERARHLKGMYSKLSDGDYALKKGMGHCFVDLDDD